jgi:hypothetical protein
METFAKLFGSMLAFVYHCFDRIVIPGHIPLLTRPENIVHFFRDLHQSGPITKDLLRKRTMNTTVGSRRSPGTGTSLWNGPSTAYVRRTTSGHTCGGWSGRTASECISFSRAWK